MNYQGFFKKSTICGLGFVATLFQGIQVHASSASGLPVHFDYNSFINWIIEHNYQSIPEVFGFNAGNVAQYPSVDVALNVVCNVKGGCNNFVFWPFDAAGISIMYYQPTDKTACGAKVSTMSVSPNALTGGVISKVYIPLLDKNFIPGSVVGKSEIIGKKGRGDWSAFEHVNYQESMMVIYLNADKLQSKNIKLLFEESSACNFSAEKSNGTNSNSQYITPAGPLTNPVELINGTTWQLISRQGVGPAYDDKPAAISYSYTVSSGMSSNKSFNLGVTLGVNLSGGFAVLNSSISAGLSSAWGSSVSVSSATSSTLSTQCSNISPVHSKVCPIYELMATTTMNAPGFDEILKELNGPSSKTPDVMWRLGEHGVTDDGKNIGTIYPVGGVFTDGISITQMADYLVPLNQSASAASFARCEKTIVNESNQPWIISGSTRELGNPKYQFTHCAPFSPIDKCIILPQKTINYSGDFILNKGYLHLVDINEKELLLEERSHATLRSCPFIQDNDNSAVQINDPTEGDLRIISDVLP